MSERDPFDVELEQLRAEKANFHMAYRMAIDEETKRLEVQIAGLKALMPLYDELLIRCAIAESERNELVMAVACKFPNETRFQTALRYIREREAKKVAPSSAKMGGIPV